MKNLLNYSTIFKVILLDNLSQTTFNKVLMALTIFHSLPIILHISSLLTFKVNKTPKSSSFLSITISVGFITKLSTTNCKNSISFIFLKL